MNVIKDIHPDALDSALNGMNLSVLFQALSATTVGILITDCTLPDNPVIYCNAAFERLTGYQSSEVIGRNCRFLHGHDRQQEGVALIRQAVKDGLYATAVVRNYKKDGTMFWNELAVSPIKDEQGVTTHFIGVQQDITSRKKLEEAVADRKAFLKTIISTIPGMVGYWDKNKKCLFANKAYLEWFGKTQEEMLGISIEEMMGKELYQKNEVYIQKALQGEYQHFERVLVKPNGEVRHTWAQYIPYHLHNEVHGFLAVVTDISEIKNLEFSLQQMNEKLEKKVEERTAQLSESHEALVKEIAARKKAEGIARKLSKELTHLNRLFIFNEMSTSIIHQLSQPLGSIANNASAAKLLLAKQGNTKETGEILSDILKDCDRTRSVLEKNRGLLRRNEYFFQEMDLNEFISNVADLIHSNIILNKVQLTIETPVSYKVKIDKVYLEQVLLNLFINAMEAMHDSPTKKLKKRELSISTQELTAGRVTISISDTGHGLSKTVMDNLFQPFFTTKKSGLGMGLPICRSIIEAHHGKFGATNNPKGGATFYFSLPIIKTKTK